MRSEVGLTLVEEFSLCFPPPLVASKQREDELLTTDYADGTGIQISEFRLRTSEFRFQPSVLPASAFRQKCGTDSFFG